MADEEQAPRTFDKLNREQLEIYAKELREHVQSERQLRQELEGRNIQLEQRVKEITALNQLFQSHLEERQAVVQAYREVLDGLRELAKGASGLEEWARSKPLPDLEPLPTLETEEPPAE